MGSVGPVSVNSLPVDCPAFGLAGPVAEDLGAAEDFPVAGLADAAGWLTPSETDSGARKNVAWNFWSKYVACRVHQGFKGATHP